MQSVSLFKDLKSRPARYIKELWQSSPVTFSAGNAFYAAATGVVGGFSVSSLPAAAIQLGITGMIAMEQVKATHNGKGYNTPFRRLAYANWATAAALVCGAAVTGTPIAFAAATGPAIVLAAWGKGHWDINRMLNRIEAGQNDALVHNASDHIDHMVERLARRSQLYFGFADCGAVVTGAVKGDTLSQILGSTIQGIAHWESLLPLAIFSLGLAKAASHRTATMADKMIPKFIAHRLNGKSGELTPNRLYGFGYAAAGIGTLATTVLEMSANNPSMLAQAVGLVSAYGIWARAYFALDEKKPEPESAIAFQNRQKRMSLGQSSKLFL